MDAPLTQQSITFLEVLYEHSMEGEGSWQLVADAFMDMVDAQCLGVFIFERDSNTFPRVEVYGECMQETLDDYIENWLMQDPRLPYLISGKLPRFFSDEQYLKNVDKKTHPFFTEWEHKLTPVRQAIGSRIISTEDYEVILSTGHASADNDTTHRAQEIFKMLHGHLSRAFEIQQLFSKHNHARNTEANILDKLEIGVVFLNQKGQVCFANKKCEDISSRNDGLTLTTQGIELADTEANGKTAALINSCNGKLLLENQPQGGWVNARRNETSHGYSILVARMPELDNLNLFSHPTVLLLISEPLTGGRANVGALTALFGLTKREVQVSSLLASGKNVSEISDDLQITSGAVRYHLKNIFGKTEVRSQAELVKLVLSIPPAHP